MKKKKKKEPRWAGQLGKWTCVTCTATAPCDEPTLQQGWLTYGCGRICRACKVRLRALPVGTVFDLGNGIRLVKVGESREEEEEAKPGS